MHAPIPRRSRLTLTIPAVFGLWMLLLGGCDTSGTNDPPPTEDDSTDTSSYTSSTVAISSDTLSLPGTLLLPDTSATVPGVVLVHGSGPIDRNGQDPTETIPPIYKRWAERMAEAGIAVLRYDKRSTLSEVQRTDPRAVTFLDFVRDAVAAGQHLQDREGVGALVLVGHSQGGNVAPAVATRLATDADVAVLAGPAIAIDSLFVAQLAASGSPSGCTASEARAQFDSLRAGQPVFNDLICGAGTTFWQQWIRHSQKADSVAAALDAPLFVQQGRADQNYPDPTLEQNLTAWRHITQAGHATVKTYEGVDHLFLNTDTTAIATAPLNDLIDWIQAR